MKTFNKIIICFIATAFCFTGCDAPIEIEPAPQAADGCIGVYFPTSNSTGEEMEPTAEKTFSFTIARTDSTNAEAVPIKVTVNDSNVFVIPDTIYFAAGLATTTFNVTFPNAKEAVTYHLAIEATGEHFVNPYTGYAAFLEWNVTLIKWEAATEKGILVDGLLSGYYNVGGEAFYATYDFTVLGDGTKKYRINNAYTVLPTYNNGDYDDPEADADGIYGGYPNNYPTDVDATQNYDMIIVVNTDKSAYIPLFQLGVTWSYGMFSAGTVVPSLSDDTEKYPLGTSEEGKITFKGGSTFLSGSAGTYLTSQPLIFYLTKDAYLADNMKIDDYNAIDYEIIDGAIEFFESNAYSSSWDQSFFKAIDIDSTNTESEYKNLYFLPNLYADDFGLAFYYDGNRLSIPAKQNTGKLYMNKKIFVSSSDNIKSSVAILSNGATKYTFGLTFHYEDGTLLGEFEEIFYYSKAPIVYSIDEFCGNFTLTGSSQFGDPDAEMAVTIVKEGTNLVISGVDYATSIVATFDASTSVMSIVPQELDSMLGKNGTLYDMTLYTTTPESETSTSAAMMFSYKLDGIIHLTSSTEADGYLIRSEVMGGWVDGYYDLTLTPSTEAEGVKAKSKANSTITGKILKQHVVTEGKTLSAKHFKVQGKKSVRTMKKINSTTVF